MQYTRLVNLISSLKVYLQNYAFQLRLNRRLQQLKMKGVGFRSSKKKLTLSSHVSLMNKQNNPDNCNAQQFNINVISFSKKSLYNSSITKIENFDKKKVHFNQEKGSNSSQAIHSNKVKRAVSTPEVEAVQQSSKYLRPSNKMQRPSSLFDLDMNQSKDTQQTVKSISTDSMLSEIIQQIIFQLKKEYYLHQNHKNNYTIKKQHLESLLTYSFAYLNTNDKQKQKQINQSCMRYKFLKPHLRKIQNIAVEEKLRERQKYLEICPVSFQMSYSNQINGRQASSLKLQVQNLLQYKQLIKKRIQTYEDLKNSHKESIDSNKAIIAKQIAQKNSLLETIHKLQFQKQNISRQIQEHRMIFSQLKQVEQRIANFIESNSFLNDHKENQEQKGSKQQLKRRSIASLVKNMQSWMAKSTIKQELLLNRRIQLVSYCERIKEKLNQIMKLICCEKCGSKNFNCISGLNNIFTWIEQICQIKNSFY